MPDIAETIATIKTALADLELMLEKEGLVEPTEESISNQSRTDEERETLRALRQSSIRF